MEADFAGMGGLNIDPATVLLGRLHEIPLRPLRPAFQHHHLGPFGGEILVAAFGNRGVLGFPKGIGVGEETVLAEQVAGDLLGEGGKVEQRELGADGGTAEQPAFEVVASRAIIVVETVSAIRVAASWSPW